MMKPSPAHHCDWRSAPRSVDDADIISLAEALARGMKPIEAVCMNPIYDPMEIEAAEDQGGAVRDAGPSCPQHHAARA